MMDSVDDYWKKNYRIVTVKFRDGTTITGKLNTGEYPRVSDFFRSSPHQFFVLTDAQHSDSTDKFVVVINKNEVMWAAMRLPSVK
ncbi:MAG: hypothetical protein JSW04_12795 [Desulfobacterales bacterium]|nr:MAG: hypothetical protein JSV38_16420 [Desulfobacterales bacterium]UCD89286.1 MAG: hypothetical protein JSW04_12795 [Desulfobacterales bacterium]